MASEIPTASRVLVRARDVTCVRCRAMTGGLQWHHRRTRSVHDEHQHCPCVGVMLCATCHKWVHEHPMDARQRGWIVSRFEDEPFTVPFFRPPRYWVLPDCEGNIDTREADTLEEAVTAFGIQPKDAEVISIEEGRR